MGNMSTIIADYVSNDAEFITYITDFNKYEIDNTIFKPLEFGLLDSNHNRIESYVRNDTKPLFSSNLN